MTPSGTLRRTAPNRWAVELDAPGRSIVGEVVQRPDGFAILMLADEAGNVPLWSVKAGPHATMVEATSAIATALRSRDRIGAY